MPYSEEKLAEIKSFADIIFDIIDNEGMARDIAPYTQKIEGALLPQPQGAQVHPEVLKVAIHYYALIADSYEMVDRTMYAVDYYDRAIALAARLFREYGELVEESYDLVYRAIHAHNYYIDDDCEDVISLSAVFTDELRIEELRGVIPASRRHLKHDPVELTDEYLAVIDEVERLVSENRTTFGFGSCHEVWELKREYLAERGIVWHSPSALNPHVMFD